jgi:TRAP transporter TAXI family solute receptor
MEPGAVLTSLPRWLRVALVVGILILAGGAGFFAYRYVTRPVALTVAAGSVDGEAVHLMSAIASRLVATKSPIRLKVVDKGTALEASKAFAAGEVDLAIVRSDVGDLSSARTVVLLTHGVVMILLPPGGSLDSIADLKGKTVGVVGGEVNHGVVAALTKEYDLASAKVVFKDLAPADVQKALKSKQVSALLLVIPVSEKYLSIVRGLFQRHPKLHPRLIAIESAGAIAAIAQAYDSYDLPKGTLRGSPPIPDDDLTTLRIPFYLVANKKLDDDRVTELTKAVMEIRRDLLGAYPLLAQVSAPSTDKDAFIPVHPGAAAYFSGDEQTFFDKYGDQIFYGSMLLGTLTSLLAGAWKFMGFGVASKSPFNPLYALADRIRHANDESELMAIEDEIDSILKAELARHAAGDSDAADAAALALAAHRLEYLVGRRRNMLQADPATAKSAMQLQSP